MYTFVRQLRFREALTAEGPALLVSLLVAEAFYKFHSFTLECAAFLATWFAASAVFTLLTRWLFARRERERT